MEKEIVPIGGKYGLSVTKLLKKYVAINTKIYYGVMIVLYSTLNFIHQIDITRLKKNKSTRGHKI